MKIKSVLGYFLFLNRIRANLLAMSSQVVLIIIISRFLGTEILGIYIFLASVSVVVTIACQMGVKQYVASGGKLTLQLIKLTFFLHFIFILFVPYFVNIELILVFALTLFKVMESILDVIYASYQRDDIKEKTSQLFYIKFASYSFTSIAVILFEKMEIAFAFGNIIYLCAIINSFRIKKIDNKREYVSNSKFIDQTKFTNIFRSFLFPNMLMASLLAFSANLPRFYLGFTSNFDELAIFGLISQVFLLFNAVFVAITHYQWKEIRQAIETNKLLSYLNNQYFSNIKIVLGIVMVSPIALFALSHTAGVDFSNYLDVTIIIAFAYCVNFLTHVVNQCVYVLGISARFVLIQAYVLVFLISFLGLYSFLNLGNVLLVACVLLTVISSSKLVTGKLLIKNEIRHEI